MFLETLCVVTLLLLCIAAVWAADRMEERRHLERLAAIRAGWIVDDEEGPLQ